LAAATCPSTRATDDTEPEMIPGRMTVSLATFALGMTLFALFFGLVAACDRL
jgi:hypothetical protein